MKIVRDRQKTTEHISFNLILIFPKEQFKTSNKKSSCQTSLAVYDNASIFCEPPHDKTNKMACAPSEDSDQPGHPPSLISAFAVRMTKAWVLSYPLSAQQRL